MIKEYIGEDWIKEPSKLEELLRYQDDTVFLSKFLNVKQQRKAILASYIQEHHHIEVDIHSIFDVQVKRLHAYKRQ